MTAANGPSDWTKETDWTVPKAIHASTITVRGSDGSTVSVTRLFCFSVNMITNALSLMKFCTKMYLDNWLSPLSRGRWYNCTSYRSMQCLNASSESNTWWFYSSIGYAERYPLASPPEVCQSYKEVLSTLRSVGDAHWAHAGASALGVCLAGIHPEGKVR